ncbi:adhesive plaque matrix protein-like [Hibiscus syriacus]|uniref:adhesive plaque matrix protein-like n=1 Tax=Hibiscus syriacus TaxID=106335 RepID=UPI0019247196|nr:adhesive plaque matrix protein-like [Hibiscus syriacus]
MALSRLSLAFSFLVLSFIAIASAGDYGDTASSKYGFDGTPADSPQAKPEEAQKPQYGTKPDYYQPKPVYKEKPGHADDSSKYGFDGIPADSPQAKPEGEEKPNYGTNQDAYKPKPEEKEKPDYSKKPSVVKPKSEGEDKPNYGTNQGTYKPKPEANEKSGYNRNSYVVKPKPDNYKQAKPDEKPSYGTKSEANYLSSAVQGTVLCKTGSKYYPIQGALATITCKAVDEIGY